MNLTTILDFATVFFAGLLAGALFVIDYGWGAQSLPFWTNSRISRCVKH